MNSTVLDGNAQEQECKIWVTAGSVRLAGCLEVPDNAQGVVVFAHGSGSSRDSSRNQYIAQRLRQVKLATLLFDLLTPDEEAIDLRTRHHLRFDIGLLASRLMGATQWLHHHPTLGSLKIGYFGVSTGSAAALVAAAECPEKVSAIVSRSGRPDLAGSALSRVKAPTLLIVGGNDMPMTGMNQEALVHLHTQKRLDIIPDTTHLFEEPGALAQVAQLASQWFQQYLIPVSQPTSSIC